MPDVMIALIYRLKESNKVLNVVSEAESSAVAKMALRQLVKANEEIIAVVERSTQTVVQCKKET